MIYQKAKERLSSLQKRVKSLFGLELDISLDFDLKGTRTIGQCKQLGKKTYFIRLHAPLLNHYKNVYIEDVLPHEMAHAVQMELYKRKVKPHGKEWVNIVEKLQNAPYNPKQNPKYEKLKDVATIKRYKKFIYTCECTKKHALTSIRHKRVVNGTVYLCRHCNSKLTFTGFVAI